MADQRSKEKTVSISQLALKGSSVDTNNYLKILTDVEEPRVSVAWWKRTTLCPEIIGGRGFLSDMCAAIRLLFFSRNYDIVILSSNRKSHLFAIMYGLLPIKKTPILMIDCLWYRPKTRLLLAAKILQFKVVAKVVNKFVVWASHEVRSYASSFLLPEEKFLYIPHHHTLERYEYEVSCGEYIFSGGDGDRDYQTLLKAVRELGLRVIIATRLNDWHGNMPVPPEVQAFPTTPDGFRKLMAGSKLVVVPMQKGLLHSGGQQTYLNAMAMGKPVIVADDRGAKDYIEHSVNGLIVSAGDVEALRAAIKSVIDNPHFAAKLGCNAVKTYNIYSTPKCIERILEAAEEVAFEFKKGKNKKINFNKKS